MMSNILQDVSEILALAPAEEPQRQQYFIRETKKLDEDGESAIAQAVSDFKAGWLHE